MEASDASHGLRRAAPAQSAVGSRAGLSSLHLCEGVFDAGSDLLVGGVVCLLPSNERDPLGLATVRDAGSGSLVVGISDDSRGAGGVVAPETVKATESLRLPGSGVPTATTNQVSAWMTT